MQTEFLYSTLWATCIKKELKIDNKKKNEKNNGKDSDKSNNKNNDKNGTNNNNCAIANRRHCGRHGIYLQERPTIL